jgi:hypothetical protein
MKGKREKERSGLDSSNGGNGKRMQSIFTKGV